MNPNQKGNVAELAIAKEAADLGLSVLKPLTEHERYDLALGIGGQLMRVQCKWANYDGDVIRVRTSRCRTSRRGFVRATYQLDEIDALAAFCGELDRTYLLPASMVAGKYSVHLRTTRPRNNQRAAVNFASDFELGAVAQLEERSDGIRKAEGSSPSSSTDQTDGCARPEVGAHEFRNQFGYYMERAAAGEMILVRRRGTPYVRVGPPPSPSVT